MAQHGYGLHSYGHWLDVSSDGCFALFTTQAEEAGNGIAQITLSTATLASLGIADMEPY